MAVEAARIDPEQVRRTLGILHRPGDVFEIRIPKSGRTRTVRGYFDDIDAAVAAVGAWSGKVPAVYVTLNPCDPALLARCANRLEPYAETTTQDGNILARRWLLVDIDPVRPSGISSSAEELDAARKLARVVFQALRGHGWPMPVSALSGNGAHLLYRIDLPNDDDSTELVRRVLAALAQQFDTERCKIDTGVFNASRISKLYGTLSAKGDHTEARPHRLAELLLARDPVAPVDRADLEAIAGQVVDPEPQRPPPGAKRGGGSKADDDLFGRVNDAALAALASWVPALFPAAKTYRNGYRVKSRELNRDLEEDLSLQPDGIRDFGTEQGMTPVDVVLAWGPVSTALEAVLWLADRLGMEVPQRQRRQKAASGAKRGKGVPTPPDAGARADEPADGDWRDRLHTNREGAVQGTISNVVLILDHDPAWRGVLAYCDFSYRTLKVKPPPWAGAEPGEWTDADTARTRIWIAEACRANTKPGDVDDAVEVVAQRHRIHPVRDYLGGLTWDGTRRIHEWLTDGLGADNSDYTRAVGQMFLISAVARVMQPGCKADAVLILEGLQGLGKSRALGILGGMWFSDTHFSLGDKDGYQQMQGVWLCELAELDSFNKAETSRAKAFFSSVSDRYRASYGRRARDHPRQCVFAGSTNQDSYLKDVTGNRRYWPVACRMLDEEYLIDTRDQLWAEAVQQYRAGERWYPTGEQLALFEPQQEARMQIDVWESMINDWLTAPEQMLVNQYTAADIMRDCLGMKPTEMKPPEQTRLGLVMHRLGWHKGRLPPSQGRSWVYQRPFEQRVKRRE